MPQSTKKRSRKTAQSVLPLLERLKELFPQAECALHYTTPFQLLVATILSAQCTDVRVNLVTPALFARMRTPEEFAAASQEEVEELIHSTGFYHHKAKHLIALSVILRDQYNGEVPRTMEELTRLPGVGRKTANCILGNAFGIADGFVVDTHVGRLARRMGLTAETVPEKVERDLCHLIPQKEWIDTSHRLILLGRSSCQARKPACATCPVADLCPKILS